MFSNAEIKVYFNWKKLAQQRIKLKITSTS